MKDNQPTGTPMTERTNPLARTILHLLAQTDERDWPDIIWVLRQYAKTGEKEFDDK